MQNGKIKVELGLGRGNDAHRIGVSGRDVEQRQIANLDLPRLLRELGAQDDSALSGASEDQSR